MRYSITTQHEILRATKERLEKRAAEVKYFDRVRGLNESLADLSSAYSCFNAQTKTTWGYIRSFIPWTYAHRCRTAYHERITETCKLLKQLEANIEKAEQLPPRKATRASSAPELPIHYPSPIAAPKKAHQSQTFTHAKRFLFG